MKAARYPARSRIGAQVGQSGPMGRLSGLLKGLNKRSKQAQVSSVDPPHAMFGATALPFSGSRHGSSRRTFSAVAANIACKARLTAPR